MDMTASGPNQARFGEVAMESLLEGCFVSRQWRSATGLGAKQEALWPALAKGSRPAVQVAADKDRLTPAGAACPAQITPCEAVAAMR